MSDYEEIARLAVLLEDRSMQQLRADRREGDQIRARIAEIDRMRALARDEATEIGALRLIGADALWQDWLLREKASLRRDEALAKAREEQSCAVAREALARREAAESLVRQDMTERRTRRIRRDDDMLDALGVLGNGPKT